jgi:hypothetical protein
VDSQEEKDTEMEFQDAKRALKAVYGHSDSESSDNEHRKTLHVMFGGFWAITSRRVKTLRREVAAAALVPKAAPHRKFVETPIGFDSSDCPKSMVGAGQLPLLVFPTISNVKLYHVLIDGGAALNLISLAAFKKLPIPKGKLHPSCPFSGVGPVSVTPCGCISLLVTFRTVENFHTESVLFDIVEVSLPFNAILGRSALYQFMAVAHYRYLVLKMPSPNGILKIRGDRDAGVCVLEKLQALAAAREAAEEPGGRDLAPSSLCQRGSASAPHVQPSGKEDVLVKTVQVGTEAGQTTRISGDLDSKWELVLVTFLRANVDVFAWHPSQMSGIPREVIKYHLNIYPDARPVQQRPWKLFVERQNFICEEIKKLLDAGFIREVHHPR